MKSQRNELDRLRFARDVARVERDIAYQRIAVLQMRVRLTADPAPFLAALGRFRKAASIVSRGDA